MWQQLKDLFQLLTKKQRLQLLKLQILVVLMALGEVVGVLSIGPFMALIGDISEIENGWLASIYEFSGLESASDFLFVLGLGVFGLLTGSTLLSMVTVWRLSMYGTQLGADMGNRLYDYYMNQTWLFHANTNSSLLTNRIAQESGRLTSNIINQLMQMNAKLVMAIFISIAILLYNPVVAFAGISIFGLSYFFLYKTVRQRLVDNGETISEAQAKRFQLMSEGFGGFKDVQLFGRQSIFISRFTNTSNEFARAHGITLVLGQLPRYAMELIAFGGIILLILYLLKAYNGDLSSVLPVLSIYALAGFKLLPAFQQVYAGMSQIRGNMSAFAVIREDLLASKSKNNGGFQDTLEKIAPKSNIVLENISFRYPNRNHNSLDSLDLNIPVGNVIGIVGASGSGKSTAIDILLGLVLPQNGTLMVDDYIIDNVNLRKWQNNIGFVPQSIFLADCSIKENIAFGLPSEAIDERKVERAVSLAHLEEFVADQPYGIDTMVGERGVQLSGGQRQRIGIARALYNDAQMLVMDEATSALDGITEKKVIEAILDLAGTRTIVMIAHRLATVMNCDVIFLMEEGHIVDKGSYNELLERNEKFQNMANLA